MLIWSHNEKIPKFLKASIFERIEENHIDKTKFYTSFIGSEGDKFSDLLLGYYDDVIKQIMINVGMYSRSTYTYNIWVQMYNSETDTHNAHSHFGGNEILSFVHIINASQDKCFYFLDNDNNKIYPDNQKEGDLFAWPSWAMHGVDKVKESNVNRLIVAGNVSLTHFYGGDRATTISCADNGSGTIIWKPIDIT